MKKSKKVSFNDCEWSIRALLNIIMEIDEHGHTIDECKSFDPDAYSYILSESRKILQQLENCDFVNK